MAPAIHPSSKGDAYGGDGGPRRARQQRDDGADDARGQKEDRRMEDLEPVVYHGGDYAACHPCTGDGADKQQDDDCGCCAVHVLDDGILELLPRAPVTPYCQRGAYGRGCQQRKLAAAHDGIAAEQVYGQRKEYDKHTERYKRKCKRRGVVICFSTHCVTLYGCKDTKSREQKQIENSVFRFGYAEAPLSKTKSKIPKKPDNRPHAAHRRKLPSGAFLHIFRS